VSEVSAVMFVYAITGRRMWPVQLLPVIPSVGDVLQLEIWEQGDEIAPEIAAEQRRRHVSIQVGRRRFVSRTTAWACVLTVHDYAPDEPDA
jgi:hypothetical protein